MKPKFVAVLMTLMTCAPVAVAQVVEYPLGGNIRADQGTIELWFKLVAEPDPGQKDSLHYFPMFQLRQEEEQNPRVRFNYATIWGPQAFHFHWSSSGRALGEFSSDPYICTVDESQAVSKGDALSPGGRYPRTPRLKKDEWHYLAITWSDGLTKPKLQMFLDGRQVLLTATLTAVWWDDIDAMKMVLLGAPYHDNFALDEFRLSAAARSAEEISRIHMSNKPPTRDAQTLLLDHMDTIDRQEVAPGKPTFSTVAEQISGFHGEKGGKMLATNWELIDGQFGKAVVITGANREHK